MTPPVGPDGVELHLPNGLAKGHRYDEEKIKAQRERFEAEQQNGNPAPSKDSGAAGPPTPAGFDTLTCYIPEPDPSLNAIAALRVFFHGVLKFSRVSVQEVLANPPPAARLHKVQLLVSSERPAASRSSPDRPYLERQLMNLLCSTVWRIINQHPDFLQTLPFIVRSTLRRLHARADHAA
ncbi:hypothetical protein FQA47_001868 [Oryzias melastigma]|uniref:Uncharacterized protein n=1 Tax=Oryzias melastigma TaxID=30732 RepID=A0A834FH03_ORYME|nr:hypothetical protein FQA47_001868 [Oryzias melastigma]